MMYKGHVAIEKRYVTDLGMMLFASSESAGQRLAIWAVSNCVKAGSRRSVLGEEKLGGY